MTGHARGLSLKSIFEPISVINANVEQAGVRAALSRVDPADARRLVEDLLSIASIAAIGGRSAAEIAERFLDQATLTSGEGVPSEKRALLEGFLPSKIPQIRLQTLYDALLRKLTLIYPKLSIVLIHVTDSLLLMIYSLRK